MGREPYMRRSGPDLEIDGQKVTPYAFMHPCCFEGCENHGGFGFKVDLRRRKPGYWYCADHKHIGEALYSSSTHHADDAVSKGDDNEHPPARDLFDGA